MWKFKFATVALLSGLLMAPVGMSAQQNPGDQNQPQDSQAQGQPAAQQPSNNQQNAQPAAPPNMKAMESMLVSRIHMVNQMEVKAGQMAASKGSAFDVREYGQRLKMDHTFADKKILAYAKTNGLQVMSPEEMMSKMEQMSGGMPQAQTKPQQMEPHGMSPQSGMSPAQHMQEQMSMAQSTMQKLQGMQGKAFDDGFTQFMVQGHTHAIAMLSMAEHMLPTSSGLRSLLGKMEPILEQHYDIASQLQIATIRRQNSDLGDKMNTVMAKMKGGQ